MGAARHAKRLGTAEAPVEVASVVATMLRRNADVWLGSEGQRGWLCYPVSRTMGSNDFLFRRNRIPGSL